MRIMHFAGGGDIGGAKTHIISLGCELAKGNDFHLISFRPGEFAEEAKEAGLQVIVAEKPWSIPDCLRVALQAVDQFKPDVIHCHGAKANLMGVLVKKRRGIPLITTVHSYPRKDYMGMPLKQLVFGNINLWALKHMDYYMAVAGQMSNYLIENGVDPQRIFTLYNGLDFSASQLQPIKRDDPDRVVLGIAARLTAIKNIPTLLEAFARARAIDPRLYLRIAGTGEEEQSLREQVKDLGLQDAVEFAGWITDMPGFFAGVDINVLPSFSEGFPYSLLEGAYDRCPAIASAVGGIPEIIDHNETGLLFEPHDVSTLTAHILLLARDPQLRRRLGDNLWQRARRDFSLEKMRETQEQVYASVLRRREHRGKRWGAVICGAYGRGNAGDDAILQAITSQMREIDPDMPLTVVSRNPKDTRLKNRTGAIYTFDLFSFWHRLRRSRLFINGGGSLIQDVTSSRSLYYYLFTLWMARRSGCRVLMYGCGIGPIKRRFNQKLAARILNRNVEVITLRDSNSRRVLAEMQVDKPRVILAADPTVNLVRSGRIGVASSFARESIPADAPKVAFCIRSWPSFIHPEYLAAAADHVYNSYGFLPVFIPIELPRDVEAASRVIQSMHVPYHACTQRYNVDELIGMLGSMKLVVGMRLHSLIFATLGRAPVVALSYDVKVSSFIRDIGGGHCMPVDSFTSEELIAAIDDVVAAGCPRAGEARECLLHGEECNIAAARGLLEDDR